jgi:hypothetical protein
MNVVSAAIVRRKDSTQLIVQRKTFCRAQFAICASSVCSPSNAHGRFGIAANATRACHSPTWCTAALANLLARASIHGVYVRLAQLLKKMSMMTLSWLPYTSAPKKKQADQQHPRGIRTAALRWNSTDQWKLHNRRCARHCNYMYPLMLVETFRRESSRRRHWHCTTRHHHRGQGLQLCVSWEGHGFATTRLQPHVPKRKQV